MKLPKYIIDMMKRSHYYYDFEHHGADVARWCAAGYTIRMCQELPKVYTKKAYSDLIEKWKPIVKHEDEEMNEPDAWQMAYM